MKMINSCQQCLTKCCRVGPGPYTPISFDLWWDNAHTSAGYNTQCENWNEVNGKCGVWNTVDLPTECRVFVCSTRSYSPLELANIRAIEDLAYDATSLDEIGLMDSLKEVYKDENENQEDRETH